MLRKRPYLFLWFLAAILCMAYGISYLFQIDTNFSLTVSDVYVVVAHSQLFLLFALWLLLCGFGYFVLGRYKITPVYSLTKLHILFTLLTFFIIIIDQFTNHNSLETVLVWVAILLFPIAQIIYFINIIAATVLNLQENTV
ncbi:hypothetical protein [Cellulophaga sp. Hel_I_12]|uniref:hypothetical protein n=1 Tax=Cellulophaga sp. Hel_I_12 TaxID=1249972 RepID=UPI000649219D|nr:hypothetical protein [Cellulophaga sp. Hel_I_12]